MACYSIPDRQQAWFDYYDSDGKGATYLGVEIRPVHSWAWQSTIGYTTDGDNLFTTFDEVQAHIEAEQGLVRRGRHGVVPA